MSRPVGVPGLRLRDFGAKLTVKGTGCAVTDITPSEVICAGNLRAIARVDIALADGNDLYAGQHGFATIVDGGAGADQYFHDGKTGLTTTRTDFRGGDGEDTASYGPATAGVIVSKDGVANDGRTITGSFSHRPRQHPPGRREVDRLAVQRLAQRLERSRSSWASRSRASSAARATTCWPAARRGLLRPGLRAPTARTPSAAAARRA